MVIYIYMVFSILKSLYIQINCYKYTNYTRKFCNITVGRFLSYPEVHWNHAIVTATIK